MNLESTKNHERGRHVKKDAVSIDATSSGTGVIGVTL